MCVINNNKGTTLIELIFCGGILAIIVMAFLTYLFTGMGYIVKGVKPEAAQIAREILHGKPGERGRGLIGDITGLYSIYDDQLDNGTNMINLYSDRIMMGYGIVDDENMICNSPNNPPLAITDFQIIKTGSITTTNFDLRYGTPTITVISPYDQTSFDEAFSQTLESLPGQNSDDHKLIISYQYITLANTGWIKGTITKIYNRATNPIVTAPFKIGKNVTRLEFRYFTGTGVEVRTGSVSRAVVNKIRLIKVMLWVDNDDDNDGKVSEDLVDNIDNDMDGKIDEDDFSGVKLSTRVFPRNL